MVFCDNRPVLSLAAMCDQGQAMGQTCVLSNWLDHGMDLQESLDAARFFLYGGLVAVEDDVPECSRVAAP